MRVKKLRQMTLGFEERDELDFFRPGIDPSPEEIDVLKIELRKKWTGYETDKRAAKARGAKLNARKCIYVRVTEAELQFIKARADEADMTIQNLVLKTLLREPRWSTRNLRKESAA